MSKALPFELGAESHNLTLTKIFSVRHLSLEVPCCPISRCIYPKQGAYHGLSAISYRVTAEIRNLIDSFFVKFQKQISNDI